MVYLQGKRAASVLAIPSKKKRKGGIQNKSSKGFCIAVVKFTAGHGEEFEKCFDSLSKSKRDMSLVLIKSPVVDTFCLQESRKREKMSHLLLISQFSTPGCSGTLRKFRGDEGISGA